MIQRILAEERRYVASLVAAIAAGVAIRIWLAFAAEGKSWSDSAIIALMAMHELRGKFYAFYWGQSYMGSLESLGVAPFFALFGVSDATLSMGLLPWYVLFAVALYLVTRRCGGPLAGAIAAWLLALAPPYVQYQQIMPRGDYPETLAFGTILLWLTLRVTHDDLTPAVERKYLLAVGVVAGLAFWTNWLVFPYFAVVGAYLLLHDWRLPLRPVMLPILAAFGLGSLPFWIYNVRHGFPTFSFVADVQTAEGRHVALAYAVSGAIPLLLGFRDLDDRFTWGWPGKALTAIAATAGIALLVALRRSLWNLLRGRVRKTEPAVTLLLLVVATVAIYSVGLPGRFHVARYLLPIVTSTLALTALALAWLATRSPALAALSSLGLVVFYGAQIVQFRNALARPGDRPGVEGPVDQLAYTLLQSGIRFGYAEYGDATITTYLTRDRVVLTDYFGARYPLDEVEFRDPAVIVRDSAPAADGTLAALNARFSVRRIPGYRIYWPIAYDGVSRAPLSRHHWTITASENDANAAQMLDDDPWTYWSVPAKKRGAAVTLDLGAKETATGLFFDLGQRGSDAFAKLRIESSLDGTQWSLVKTADWGFPVYFEPSGQVTTVPSSTQYVLFPPLSARWLRLTLVANFANYDWSIGELGVFGPGTPGAALHLPEFADPASPAVTERRLRLQSAREPESDGPLVELRRLYRSLGEWEKLREVERIEAERFRPAVHVGWRFGPDLRLLGYGWRALGPRRAEITYYWQALRTMDEDYAAYLRLRGGGRLLPDDHFLGAPHATKRWLPEEIVKDVRAISVPADFPDGSYEARIGVWMPRNKRHVRLGRFGWWGERTAPLFHLGVEGETVSVKRIE
ncbi:MAG TPA: discoidin domain-containing protein [Candidatus Binatia bacterium]|nr:discoidin domain-containing protein [Candidatus Binatia bacterium]